MQNVLGFLFRRRFKAVRVRPSWRAAVDWFPSARLRASLNGLSAHFPKVAQSWQLEKGFCQSWALHRRGLRGGGEPVRLRRESSSRERDPGFVAHNRVENHALQLPYVPGKRIAAENGKKLPRDGGTIFPTTFDALSKK